MVRGNTDHRMKGKMKIQFKAILTTALSLYLLASCNSKTGNGLKTQPLKNKKLSNNFVTRKVANSMPYKELPLGPSVLKNYRFPKDGWDKNTYFDIPDSEKTKNDKNGEEYTKKFNEIDFNYLNLRKSYSPPDIGKVNYINILDDSLLLNRKIYLKEGYKFRLPDFGPYQCYYQCYSGPKLKSVTTKKIPIHYDTFSNIVFIDPKTRTANILNIYSSYYLTEDIDYEWRFFYIDKDKTIEIFTAGSDEERTGINKVLLINVQRNGKFSLKNIK